MKYLILIICIIGLPSCFSKKKNDIPSFNLLMIDSSTVFNTNQIPEGRPAILLFFSPDCEHCQAETEDLLKNMDSLKNVNFYFITIDPMERLKVFNGYYKLFRYKNITLGRDYTFSFPSHFKGAAPPYSVVYDGNKKISAIFSGVAKANQFLAIIHQM